MLKKTITYKDLDGNPITEDFYFAISKAELAKMELSYIGGFTQYIRTIVKSENAPAILEAFEQIIAKSVGKKSDDGKRFIKTKQISDEFMQTDAYSQLFMELVSDGEAASVFVNGIVPDDMNSSNVEAKAVPAMAVAAVVSPDKPASEYTREELVNMPTDQFNRIVGTNVMKMSRYHIGVAMDRKMSE